MQPPPYCNEFENPQFITSEIATLLHTTSYNLKLGRLQLGGTYLRVQSGPPEYEKEGRGSLE